MKRRDFTRSFGKSYDGPRLRNPLFAVREISKSTKYAVLTCGVVLLLGIPALFVYAPFMRYSDIRVQGLTTIAESDVTAVVHSVTDKRKWFVLPGAHIVLIKTNAIVDALDAQFHFATLSLYREGRTLVVDARERITEIAWTVAGKTYFVDLTGVAVREATTEAIATIAARRAHVNDIPLAPGVQPTMPIIDVREGTEPGLGAAVIDTDRLAHILTLDAALRTRGLSPIAYTLDTASTPWLTVSVLEHPSLLVDIVSAPDTAMLMYDAFVHGRDGGIATLAYIDLRFGDHVYSKERRP